MGAERVDYSSDNEFLQAQAQEEQEEYRRQEDAYYNSLDDYVPPDGPLPKKEVNTSDIPF